MDRKHRHDLKHDRFVDEIGALSGRARENQRLLIAIAAGVVGLAVLIYGIYFYRSNREVKAQQALSVAIETYDADVVAEPQEQTAAVAGPTFKTDQERIAAAEPKFNEVRTKFRGTRAADVAAIYLSQIAVSRGDVASARTLLESFVKNQRDHILTSTARFSLYALRIESGEAGAVATEITAELAKPEPSLPGDSLLILLAHAYDAQGDQAKSLEAYRRITVEFPDSPYALDAQRRIGRA
jgi:predicted negative regulator of RcsB-dependent stress response